MRATVIVPTHDHGPLIEYAVGSALGQTESDIEVIVVGDGILDTARPAVEGVVASDPRVRLLDRPKGPGHGFWHRDEAIRDARAEKILYLSDDDVWVPEHVELVCTALEEADFVASLPFAMGPGRLRLKAPHDLALPGWRQRLLDRQSMISLSLVGHSRALYSGLETGWRMDEALYSDVWRDFAIHAERMATVARPTGAILGGLRRNDMSADERLAEIAQTADLLRRPEGRLELMEQLFEFEVRRWSRVELESKLQRQRLKTLRAKAKRQRG